MVYVYLAIAIIAEVAATSALKASHEFTRLVPSLIVVAGLGIVLISIMGAVLYKEIPDVPAMIGMGLIILGVAVIHVYSDVVG